MVSSTCQCRNIVTMITRPFSKSKSAKAQIAQQQQQQPSLDDATTTAPPLPLTNLPYFIRRTPSNQLPVYLSTKSGGTRQETKLRKTEGDLETLRTHLMRALKLEDRPSDVTVNHTNGHITVKVCTYSLFCPFIYHQPMAIITNFLSAIGLSKTRSSTISSR